MTQILTESGFDRLVNDCTDASRQVLANAKRADYLAGFGKKKDARDYTRLAEAMTVRANHLREAINTVRADYLELARLRKGNKA